MGKIQEKKSPRPHTLASQGPAAAAGRGPKAGAKPTMLGAAKGSSAAGKPAGAAKSNTSGIVFNKDFGQHILKNPLVSTAIVEKVICNFYLRALANFPLCRQE